MPFDIDLRAINTSGSSGITNTLRDINNSNTLTQSGSPSTPTVSYHLDASGYPLVVAACGQVTTGECQNNGLTYINGNVLPTGPSLFSYTQSTAATPSGTQYIPISGIGNLITATESSVNMLMARAGTVSGVYVKQSANEGAGASLQFTLRKNGTSESVACNIASSTHSCSDITNSFSFSAGDVLDIQLVQTGTGVSGTIGVSITYY